MITIQQLIDYHAEEWCPYKYDDFEQVLENMKGYPADGTFVQNFKKLIERCTPPMEEWRDEPSVMHCYSNLRTYFRQLHFGFEEININDSGWLAHLDWSNQHREDFKISTDKYSFNSVKVGQSPNGLWTYGYNITASSWGSSSGLSIYEESFETKELALLAACRNAESKIKASLKTEKNKKDIAYMQNVLAQIRNYIGSLISQLMPKREISFTNLACPGESVQLALF
jgi:hypothetical protein